MFSKKLAVCAVVYDFRNDDDAESKEEKRQTLLELIDFVNVKKSITEAMYKETIDMVRGHTACHRWSIVVMSAAVPRVSLPGRLGLQSAVARCMLRAPQIKQNLFRPLPPGQRDLNPNYDAEEDEPYLEPSWPHLQLVYEFFLRFIVSSDVDPKVAKRYIDKASIIAMLELFDSEDPRERDYLKTILHRVYGKFMSHRPFIRRAINNTFYRFIYEKDYHNGISELLEILGSIINGFALPLKDEHKTFLVKALIPLHKPKNINAFQQQLSYCVTQFVEKDAALAETVIRGLLQYWPATNSAKAVLYLGELEELLELTQPQEFLNICEPLFKTISRCLMSPHFQVAERALFLWNNEYIVQQITNFKKNVFPIVFASLAQNAEGHWNSTVHGLTYNVQKLLMEMDSELYDAEAAKYEAAQAEKAKKEQQAEAQWAAVSAMAA